jgi:hypothetical protein
VGCVPLQVPSSTWERILLSKYLQDRLAILFDLDRTHAVHLRQFIA